jgi:hypothetical protein
VQLIARSACGCAAVLLLIAPSSAFGINGGDPAADYARADNCTNGTPKAPVGVVFENFASKPAVTQALDTELGSWSSPDPQDQVLKLKGASSIYCAHEDPGRLSPTSSDSPPRRTYMRLWGSSVVSAGTPTRQYRTTSLCGATPAAPKWIATQPNGYNDGRNLLEYSFQGPETPYGPYPLTEYNWGNSNSIEQCDGSMVASSGSVAIIHPKDDFGYSDRWFQFGPNADPDQDPFQLAQNAGVTVVRYAANWNTVGAGGSNTTGLCTQRPGSWTSLDLVYERLTGHEACTDNSTANPPDTVIRPLLFVRGAPTEHDVICDSVISQTALVADTAAANAAWQGFVQNVADRYQRARGIEIWNEPNLPKYWGGCNPNPGRYADLLQLANDGIAASSHPNIPIVLGSMAPNEDADSSGPEWRPYLGDVATAVGTSFAAQFDVLGLHPYRSKTDRTADQTFRKAATVDVGEARTFLQNHGSGGKPVWVTEVGASTGEPVGDPKHVANGNELATVLQNVYQGLRNEAEVPLVMLYRFSDSPNPNLEHPGYGVLYADNDPDHPPFSQKLAYRCLKLTRGLGGLCP